MWKSNDLFLWKIEEKNIKPNKESMTFPYNLKRNKNKRILYYINLLSIRFSEMV